MKIAIGVLIVLVALAGGIAGGAQLLPQAYEVKRSVTIRSRPEKIFAYVNNLERWQSWTIWCREEDPSLMTLFSGPERGVGSQRTWEGNKTGKGRQIITDSEDNTCVTFRLSYPEEDRQSVGDIVLAKTDSGTAITWLDKGSIGSGLVSRYRGLLLSDRVGAEMEQNLSKLKKILEEPLPAPAKGAVTIR